jgi:tRNA dimethylallyltransferase
MKSTSGSCVDAEYAIVSQMQTTVHASPVIFLLGPTASGKTELAAALAELFPIDLISVDAAQVYRGMDIGTAKPSRDFLIRYPHHLIDIRNPEETYSAADFIDDARKHIGEIQNAGRVPLLVGGTMFYFKALEQGLSALPAANSAIRRQINLELEEQGVRALHERLSRIDPISARRIDENDSQRVQRALEIYDTCGTAPSELMSECQGLSIKPIKLALFDSDRSHLHERITRRFHKMLDQGLVDEVSNLIAQPFISSSLTSMRTVGYRQVLAYLEGTIEHAQMIEQGTAATRQLAKRQLTWMRQQSGLIWFDINNSALTDTVAQYLLQRVNWPVH